MAQEEIENVDVLIAGAGPSGASSSKILSSAGMDVLVLESKMEVGSPVICADAVNMYLSGLEPLRNDNRVFISPMNKLRVRGGANSAGFEMKTSTGEGDAFNSVVERDRLDKELITMSLIDGTRLQIRSELLEYRDTGEGITASYRKGGKEKKVNAAFLVIATGMFSPGSHPEVKNTTWFNYSYSRNAFEQGEKTEIIFGQGGALNYHISRYPNEHNRISIGLVNSEKNSPLVSGTGDIITGNITRGVTADPDMGSGRVLYSGSASGLHDPFFLTGFREAYLSGQISALSIIKSNGKAEKVIADYSRKINSDIIPGMEAGWLLRRYLNSSGMVGIEKFMNYLSGFDFSEISAQEIIRKTSLKETELKEIFS